jgi:hypothetical protein
VPIHFEALVDSTRQIFASKADLTAIKGAASSWRTESSGILLDEAIAEELERMVVGKSAKPINDESSSNPDWTRDELIVALSFYLHHRPNSPGKDSQDTRNSGAGRGS